MGTFWVVTTKYDLKLYLNGSRGYYKGKKGASECCVSTSTLTTEDILKERDRICQKYSKRFRGLRPNLSGP